jgi:hypothetical protein
VQASNSQNTKSTHKSREKKFHSILSYHHSTFVMRSCENDRRIRNRFIRSLGILQYETSADLILGKNNNASQLHRNILSETIIEVPLKNHCGHSRLRVNKCKAKNQKNSTYNQATEEGKIRERTHSRIQFNSVVQVKTIPSHVRYSDRVRKYLWSNRHELQESTERNMREFAFEGWNVNHVIEEDDMFFDRRSHEFIHPVHVPGYSYCY